MKTINYNFLVEGENYFDTPHKNKIQLKFIKRTPNGCVFFKDEHKTDMYDEDEDGLIGFLGNMDWYVE